jgi:predicted esterase
MSEPGAGGAHAGQPLLRSGSPISRARLAVVLVHGRGGSAEDIMGVAAHIRAQDIAFLAPQAQDGTWYPYSFLSPLAQNEPRLSSALGRLSALVDDIHREGLPTDRIALLGFSQGACLALEFAARNAAQYAAIAALSGGLIGPPGTPRNYEGTFGATPVFLGCNEQDPHIPLERVHESADVFRRMGARVDERIYPGPGHSINRDELDAVDALLSGG